MLLRELLFLEVELNRDRGRLCAAEEYKARFPEAAGDIDAAFAEGRRRATSFGRGEPSERLCAIPDVRDAVDGVPASSAR